MGIIKLHHITNLSARFGSLSRRFGSLLVPLGAHLPPLAYPVGCHRRRHIRGGGTAALDAPTIRSSYRSWILTGNPFIFRCWYHFHESLYCPRRLGMITEGNPRRDNNLPFAVRAGRQRQFGSRRAPLGSSTKTAAAVGPNHGGWFSLTFGPVTNNNYQNLWTTGKGRRWTKTDSRRLTTMDVNGRRTTDDGRRAADDGRRGRR